MIGLFEAVLWPLSASINGLFLLLIIRDSLFLTDSLLHLIYTTCLELERNFPYGQFFHDCSVLFSCTFLWNIWCWSRSLIGYWLDGSDQFWQYTHYAGIWLCGGRRYGCLFRPLGLGHDQVSLQRWLRFCSEWGDPVTGDVSRWLVLFLLWYGIWKAMHWDCNWILRFKSHSNAGGGYLHGSPLCHHCEREWGSCLWCVSWFVLDHSHNLVILWFFHFWRRNPHLAYIIWM